MLFDCHALHIRTVPYIRMYICMYVLSILACRLMKVARERLKHIFKETAFFEGTESDPRKHEFVKTLLVRECHRWC